MCGVSTMYNGSKLARQVYTCSVRAMESTPDASRLCIPTREPGFARIPLSLWLGRVLVCLELDVCSGPMRLTLCLMSLAVSFFERDLTSYPHNFLQTLFFVKSFCPVLLESLQPPDDIPILTFQCLF
jgi:hypothetical protein